MATITNEQAMKKLEELRKLIVVIDQFEQQDRKRVIDAASIYLEGGLMMARLTGLAKNPALKQA